MDLPLLSFAAPGELSTGAWPYAGGIILWKDIVDFFDDMTWVKGRIEETISEVFKTDVPSRLKVTKMNIEAVVPEANNIKLYIGVENLIAFSQFLFNKKTVLSWVQAKFASFVVPDKLIVHVTLSLRVVGPRDNLQFKVYLEKAELAGSMIAHATKFVTYLLPVIQQFFGDEGVTLISRSSHWLFKPYQRVPQSAEYEAMLQSYTRMMEELDKERDQVLVNSMQAKIWTAELSELKEDNKEEQGDILTRKNNLLRSLSELQKS